MENVEQIIFTEPRKTFLEILKVNQLEVQFANILAFFFRPNENYKLDTLFLDALLEAVLINLNQNSH